MFEVALADGAGLGALGDDQAGARALRVVLDGEVAGHAVAVARLRVSGAITRRLRQRSRS